MPKVGLAQLPLDTGRCPRWLFERMKRLSRFIIISIIEEFGEEEFLKRLSDPVWFQSLSAVIGMDWNSSGTTTITLGAIKSGISDIQKELGIFICGGKRNSRKTPQEIERYGIIYGFSFTPKLIYASKMAAKVDSCLIQNFQDNFQLYHHNFLFTKKGNWCVIQQAMAPEIQKARRYHWLSSNIINSSVKSGYNFIEEPHSGIVSDIKIKSLNLIAKESRENKKVSVNLVKEEPKNFLKNIKLILKKKNNKNNLIYQRDLANFTEMKLKDVEFHWHPVVYEKFDLKRLEKTIFSANERKPESFEDLLSIKGIGPKTIRALSLVSEIIYGAKPSYEDPARYSFCVGGKDGTPYFVEKDNFDRLLEIMERAIKRSKLSQKEKVEAQKRLINTF